MLFNKVSINELTNILFVIGGEFVREFKVFYSWQSDLPKNVSSSFIQNCINDAIKVANKAVNGVEILADRDTKGMTGSPSIPQTILKKIDECDLFIADISIVNKYYSYDIEKNELDDDEAAIHEDSSSKEGIDEKKVVKYTPNPNVLIELGYAVKRLGWERIICLINTDFGEIRDLPFDIDHQRVTHYSLENFEKSRVKKEISSIITYTILEFAEKPALPKQGKAFHIIGSYDCNSKQISSNLVAYNVRNCSWIDDYQYEHRKKAKQLIDEIQTIKLPFVSKKQTNFSGQSLQNVIDSLSANNNLIDYSIPGWMKEDIISLSKEYLDIESFVFDETFFNVGDIKLPMVYPGRDILGRRIAPSKQGGVLELDKDQKIQDLLNILTEMEKLDLYLKSFDDVLLLPLAIENTSSELDNNIEIIIKVIDKDVSVLWPDKELIIRDLSEARIEIYQSDFIRCLLRMREDGDIKYETDMWYDNTVPFGWSGGILEFAQYDDSDYEKALSVFIATPINENEYSFIIKSLKAGEKKWIGAMIALNKSTHPFELTYRIKSNKTDGNNEGKLLYSSLIN